MATCRDLVEVGFDTSQARVLGFDTGITRADYTPTITCSGSMTILSSSVIRQPSWQYIGDGLIYYQGHMQVELGGTASDQIIVSLPVDSPNSQDCLPVCVRDAGSGNLVDGYGAAVTTGNGLLLIYKADRTNWTLGAGRRILWRVIYEVDAVL
jgi:hypothetical protein